MGSQENQLVDAFVSMIVKEATAKINSVTEDSVAAIKEVQVENIKEFKDALERGNNVIENGNTVVDHIKNEMSKLRAVVESRTDEVVELKAQLLEMFLKRGV